MIVKRVTANIETSDIGKADTFYHDVLGLERIMDLGWILTYGSNLRFRLSGSQNLLSLYIYLKMRA
jgi:catechol-2,3-dioxygenase